MDIRCVRMQPYRDEQRVLVDVQQVIPLPEAQDYVIRIREKAVKERIDRAGQEGRLKLRNDFWKKLLERSFDKTELFSNVTPTQDNWLATGSGISGVHFLYFIRQHDASIQFELAGEEAVNKARFDWLHRRKEGIEKSFGGRLEWNRCDNLKKSYIGEAFEGGYRDDQERWPTLQDEMIDGMIRLEKAVRPYVQQLKQITSGSNNQDAEAGNLE